MTLTRITAPQAELVTLDQLKAHLRVDGADDADYLAGCLQTAVAVLDGDDGELGRALIYQDWRQHFARAPTGAAVIELDISPVEELLAVEFRSEQGPWVALDLAAVRLFEEQGRFFVEADAWPRVGQHRNPFRVTFRAGYGAASNDVPAPIRHAVLLLAAHYYEIREPVTMGSAPVEVPRSIDSLIAPYKVWWR